MSIKETIGGRVPKWMHSSLTPTNNEHVGVLKDSLE